MRVRTRGDMSNEIDCDDRQGLEDKRKEKTVCCTKIIGVTILVLL